jgi:hypothetical protein
VGLPEHRGRGVKYSDVISSVGEGETLPPRASSRVGDPGRRRREVSSELVGDKRVAHHPSEGLLVRKEGVSQV